MNGEVHHTTSFAKVVLSVLSINQVKPNQKEKDFHFSNLNKYVDTSPHDNSLT